MSIIERSVELAANRDEVFSFVTHPDNFPTYVAGYRDGTVTTDKRTGLDSAFEWTSRLGPWPLRAEERVTSWQPPAHVAYQGTLAGVPFESRMDLMQRADGNTELSVAVDYTVPAQRGGRVADALIRRPVERDVERSLRALQVHFAAVADAPPSPDALRAIYRRRAARYDVSVQLYRLFGYRLAAYRRMAADALALERGDTVVEIGCGTGANFELLEQRVGPEGRIIGVDLTDAMLAQAEQRVAESGWSNVELVLSDASTYEFPAPVNGILSTFALTHCAAYDAVIERGARALAPEGRWVVLDLKQPEAWSRWSIAVGLAVTKPFGVTLSAGSRHPWEALERHLPRTTLRELYFGVTYLAVGRQGPSPHHGGGAA